MKIKKIIALILVLCVLSNVFSQTIIDIEPFTEDNIPSWAEDARRMSVVSIGSIPFTTLSITLGYTVYRYIANDFSSDYIPSPFPTSSAAAQLNSDEQVGILLTATALGLVIGIVDLIVVNMQENREEEEIQREQAERVIITPVISTDGATE